MKIVSLLVMASLGTVVCIPALVSANTINYGDKVGITMVYSNVQETSLSGGDTAPLYGAPTLSGDSLVFLNMTFSSQASNGASDITDGKLDTDIASKNNPSYYIDHLLLQEFGDTTLAGSGTPSTYSSAANSIFITVLELDNTPLVFPVFITTNMPMSDGGMWTLPPPITGKQWTGAINLDITGILQGLGYSGHATLLHLTTDNTLATGSELDTEAFIAKKAEGLSVTAIVPEPSALSLVVLGGAFLVARRFRRKS
jgi:hypothetical protein